MTFEFSSGWINRALANQPAHKLMHCNACGLEQVAAKWSALFVVRGRDYRVATGLGSIVLR